MKRALIIYNPNAGIKVGNNISALVQKELQKLDYSINLFFLDKNYEKNISDFDFNGISLVIAIGGDGTVKVAARTILENKLNAKLAIVPFGSANIVATSLGLPMNPHKAIKTLRNIKNSPIDVGVINDKYYFIVGFSAGYVSDVVSRTATKLKNRFGFGSYFISVFTKNLEIKRKKFFIDDGKQKIWIKGNSLIVLNACNFYGFKPKMAISPNDGILDLLVMTNRNFWTLMAAGIHFLIFREPRQYFFHMKAKKFKVRFKRPITCQIDGDYIELPKNIDIKIIPSAIKITNYVQ
ncbi:MAG: YegS/Rv2252/BmrU family lipid kinase [Candidatus Buchananbacteria bacterium]